MFRARWSTKTVLVPCDMLEWKNICIKGGLKRSTELAQSARLPITRTIERSAEHVNRTEEYSLTTPCPRSICLYS